MLFVLSLETARHTVGCKIIGPPWISPIGSNVKQVMQYWALWLQIASNCHKYDVVSIFRASTSFALKGNCIWIPAFILDIGPDISKLLEPLFSSKYERSSVPIILEKASFISDKGFKCLWNYNIPVYINMCCHNLKNGF